MNREALRAELEEKRVDPRSYSLDGEPVDEAYVLEPRPGSFAVFYAERGLRTGEKVFASEDEACRYLLTLLLQDRTTRIREDGSPPG
jgi:hypothetical protein